jgi:large subunit ribosomal protein L23
MKVIYDVIKEPYMTEKSNLLQETENKVSFKVASEANKIEIRQAVEQLFKVKVASVRTVKMRGKRKRIGARPAGRTSDWKKAYIKLSEGKINYLDEL